MDDPEQDPVWFPFLDGLRAFVARRVPAGEADDVLQDVLLRLHRAAPTLRDGGRAQAWVYGVARRAVADVYRRRAVPTDTADAEQLADPAPPPENLDAYDGDHDVHEEVLSWLRPMAEALPEPYRHALVLADFEGHTQQHVADAVGLSLSGAKSRVQRARAMLADAVRLCCEVEFGPDARASAFRRLECDRC